MSVILRERKLPSGKTQLYLDIYLKGRRRTEALRFYLTGDRNRDKEIRRLAEAVRGKREFAFYGDEEGIFQSDRARVNFFAFARSVYEGKKELTRRTYENAFTHLEDYSDEDLTFEIITPKFCSGFKDYLLNHVKLKQNSGATYYERLRIILRKAIKEGIIKQNPSEGISITTAESLPKYLTEAQLKQLLGTDCENQDIRNAFIFSCSTGMRYGDISTMEWKQIRGDNVELIQRKTGIAQSIPLNVTALGILSLQKKKAVKPTDLVFAFPRRSTVDKALKRWAKRAKVDFVLSFHKARHTFGTLMLTKRIDIYTVSKILGHKSLDTTQIYARVIDEKKREAVDRLPNLIKK